MKIQYTTPINNGYTYTNKDAKNIKKNNQSVEIPMISNSLSEAIGRSQVVSFSGENKIKGSVFEHSCSELWGDKENISYNKQDGSFCHTVVGRDGQLKRQEEFFPLLNKEIVTKVSNGEKTITTRTPSMNKTEKYNENGEQIYLEESGLYSKKMVITDFELGRRIIAEEVNGQEYVKVIDLKTNMSVTSGDLVLQRFYDQKTDTYLTENIITGQVLKKEKFRSGNKYESIIEYAPGTGNVTREYLYDSRTGGYSDISYYESGAKKSLVKISRNGRKEDTYKFAKDGKTVLSHVLYETGKYGNLECETTYFPDTDLIDSQILYGEESCTKYFFKRTPNIPHSAEHYQDGKLVEEIKFQKDGETYEFLRQYAKNGNYRDNFYDRYGYKTHSKSYTADNYLYQELFYNSNNENLIKSIDYERLTGNIKESFYDEETGLAKKIIIYDANGVTKEVNEYYLGTTTLKSKIEYNADGSFSYTKYDESGAAWKREEYYADGTKKHYNRNSSRQNYGNYSYTTTNHHTESKTLTADEVIEHVLNVTSSSAKSISEINSNEWAKLAEIFGVENPNELMNMNKETYRKLSKKVHPDLQKNEAQKELGEKLFKIIQNLYTNAGRGTHI